MTPFRPLCGRSIPQRNFRHAAAQFPGALPRARRARAPFGAARGRRAGRGRPGRSAQKLCARHKARSVQGRSSALRFPNFAAARAAAIWGGARRRRPAGPEGGWGRCGEGRVGAPTQPSTPFGQRGPVQCKARAQPPPGVAGSGFGSQFKILNPKRCTDPKMANSTGLPRKKLSGSVIGRPEKFTSRPKSGQIP